MVAIGLGDDNCWLNGVVPGRAVFHRLLNHAGLKQQDDIGPRLVGVDKSQKTEFAHHSFKLKTTALRWTRKFGQVAKWGFRS